MEEPTELDHITKFYSGVEIWEPFYGDERIPRFILNTIFSDYEDKGNKTEGFVLYGPPGVGMSLLIRNIAWEAAIKIGLKIPVFTLTPAVTKKRYTGEAIKFISSVFQEAEKYKMSIIVLDKFGPVLTQRPSEDWIYKRTIQSTIKSHMDDFRKCQGNRTMVVFCTTNRSMLDLDSGFLSRFHHRIFIGLPSEETRLQIIVDYLKGKQVWESVIREVMEKKDVVLRMTKGASGKDIRQRLNKIWEQEGFQIRLERVKDSESGDIVTIEHDVPVESPIYPGQVLEALENRDDTRLHYQYAKQHPPYFLEDWADRLARYEKEYSAELKIVKETFHVSECKTESPGEEGHFSWWMCFSC